MTTSSPDIRLSDDVLRQLHENIADMFQSTDMQDVSTIQDTIKQTMQLIYTPAQVTQPRVSEPVTMTAEQAAEYGLDVPEGWSLQTEIGENGDVSFSMVDADGWKIDDSGMYTAPDGTTFTQDELQETMNVQDVIERNKNLILMGINQVIASADWPEEMKAADVSGETILSWALQSPENSQAFSQGLLNVGTIGFKIKTEDGSDYQQYIDDSFTVLKYLGYQDEDLQQMFPDYKNQVYEANEGTAGKVGDWFYNTFRPLGHAINVAFEKISTPVAIPVAALVARIGGLDDQDKEFFANLNELYNKYGWTACFSHEATQVYENWQAPAIENVPWIGAVFGELQKIPVLGGLASTKGMIGMVNPVWFIPGTTAALAAEGLVVKTGFLTKVPALTEILRTTTRLVQFVEGAPGKVIGLPFKGVGAANRWFTGANIKGDLALAGAERAAGEAFARDISELAIRPAVQDWARGVITEPKNVFTKLPTYAELAPQMFAESPARKLGLTAIKTPGVGRLIEKAYRFTPNAKLIAGNTMAWSKVSGEIGKISLYTQTLYGMGTSTANQIKQILRSISYDPIKLFDLDKDGISRTIKTAAGRGGESRAILRILENPSAYKLSTKQLQYIAVIHSTLDDIYRMMSKEGIVIKKTAVADLEHYVHRVVEDVNRNAGLGMKGRIGRVPTFAKTRTVGEVTEEVAREIAYARNPEVLVESYIKQGIKKIADKRMAELVQNLPGVRVSLENPVYKDFKSALSSASRGATIKPEIINSIEREFPDLGRRFRAATKMATIEDEAVKSYLQKSWDQIKELQQQLAAKEVKPAATAGEVAAPSIETFTKTMEAMSYDDRLLFLDTFEGRMAELDRMAGEMSQELQVMKEFLDTDIVASYRGKMGGRTTSLLSILDKTGKFPETLTPKQAELLLMGRELKPNAIIAAGLKNEGRVHWEYIMDELAEHFRMTEQEFINHLENLKATRLRMDDLKGLIDDAVTRKTELEGMRDAVNAVNRKAVNLPTSEEGRPIWATEKPLPTEEELLRPPMGAGEYKPVSSILDEIPPVVRTGAERKAELESIRTALDNATHPTAKLGEQQLFHPSFRGWALPPEIVRTINYFWDTRSNSFLKFTAEAAGVLRSKAAMDFSAMMIQGLPAMGATMATLNPKYMVTWLKGWVEGLEVWCKPEVYAKWAAEHNVAIQQRISFGGTQMAADWFEATPRLLGWAKHIPGGDTAVRQTYGRFEAQFSFSLDYMRQTTWEALSPAAIKSGNAFKLAEMCDHMVGVTSREMAGVPAWYRDLESSFGWFAPNYTHACLQLIGDIFRGKYMAWQAVKALSGMMGAMSLVYYTYCKATGQEPNMNPLSRGFMTSTVDGFTVKMGGFWNGQMRLLVDIWNSARDNWDTPIDFFWITKEGALNKENPFLYWWYKRSSALTHFGIDTMWQHRDFSGHDLNDPLSYAKYMLECITPIATDAMLQNVLWGDKQAGWKIFLAELIGLNTYPSSLYIAFTDQANIYIKQMQSSEIESDQMAKWQKGELTWDDLSQGQQATLMLRYPDLVELENAAQDSYDQFATPLRRDFWNASDNARQFKIDRGNALTEDLMNGVDSTGAVFNTKSFMDQVKLMNSAYGVMYDNIRNDPRFTEIYAEWDGQKDPQDAQTVDVAYNEYLELVIGGDYESADGIFNVNTYSQAIDDFKTRWGIDIYNQVQTILESNKLGENPLVVQLWKDKRTLSDSGYWDMPTDTTEQRTARNDFLKANPNINALLFFWGYSSNLHGSVAAYNLVVKMCEDTGVPYTSVGGTGKLPPSSVAQDYLDYQNQELTGWDRQNYLRDHQTLYEWGQTNLGWDGIDFSTVPTPEMKKILDDYESAGIGDPRLRIRCQNQELDNWLVNVNGLKAAYGTDRCTRLGY